MAVDFIKVTTRCLPRRGVIEVYPKFIVGKPKDLMIRGGDFYAVWLEERGLWSTDEQDAIDLIDREIQKYMDEMIDVDLKPHPLFMWDAESGMIDRWHKYCQNQMRDNYHNLDETLIFSNNIPNKKDYASKRLEYPLEQGEHHAWDRLISTLYSPEERHKIEWCIGSIVSGDSKKLQKFAVLYGSAGTGKSTILNIIQKLFDGYYSVFDAKALGSSTFVFALEAFKCNPLVAIQHDGDLSKIEDNTRLNSLVSHELMTINEKYKSQYTNCFKAFLFMGTNKPVKITDGKSGLLRRLIDISPTGNKLPNKEYNHLMRQIDFELGPIAYHCLQVYLDNPNAYDKYTPMNMLGASNDFYNYVLEYYHIFKKEDGTTLKIAWEMYNQYIEEARVSYPLNKRAFKEELKNYFEEYSDEVQRDGDRLRFVYSGFKTDIFEKVLEGQKIETKADRYLIDFDSEKSLLDDLYSDCPAQYASDKGTPLIKWNEVTTTLKDLDTTKLHYVKTPNANHIVIDFDLKDDNGVKSYERNLQEASKFPPTYSELSQSGAAIHLHYIYSGDVSKLSRIYDEDIEIKVFNGNSSLRRKLSKCNDLPIATISSGLPLKGESKVINWDGVKNEMILRSMIKKNLNKEYHAATKPSVDYIYKLLEDAYNGGLKYDVRDLKPSILAFAMSSTHQAEYCVKLVSSMKFMSDETVETDNIEDNEKPIVFYDVEVFPNLFLLNWKFRGKDQKVVRMINPSPKDIEMLLRFRLIGFNCRRYDNHMIYACMLGYSNIQLYEISQRIISGSNNGFFGEAYNLSYTDVYDFAAKKQSLKKWEIELGIHHKELGIPWDQPVPENRWIEVAEYCDNDVIATEAVFDHCAGDFSARKILAELAEMTVNDTTNSLTTRIIFGREKHPQLVYTDLATGKTTDPEYQRTDIITAFPGYEYKDGKNMFRGDDLGKGGYVYAEPGIYWGVALLDIASLHPNSIRAMNCFGKYTKRFTDIVDARVYIKHKDFDSVRHMFEGRLIPYLEDESTAKDLAQALKIAINSVYGLTSASFDNPFKDSRNDNNIVALRGALFMRTLQDEVQARGFTVAHIKTDSIKIPNATPEIIEFCMDFAKQYGYTFEHEATYERMCLVNDAVYIAKYEDTDEKPGKWTATGTQFQIPYVFKTLFSREPIEFYDMCETKSVTSALYLDRNENHPDVTEFENVYDLRHKKPEQLTKSNQRLLNLYSNMSDDELRSKIGEGHNYIFVGKVGHFCPIKDGCGGGVLVREAKDPKTGEKKFASATGAKGYRWLESETVRELRKEDDIDLRYFRKLVDDAVDTINKYGDFEHFVSDGPRNYYNTNDEYIIR